jgi:hypothetical protein
VTSGRTRFCHQGPRSDDKYNPRGFSSRLGADRVEHRVVRLLVAGEVLDGVIDDPVGAQTPHQFQVRRVANSGHRGVEILQELHRRRADGAGSPIDQNLLPGRYSGRLDERERVMRTLRTGSGLGEGHSLRNDRDHAVLRNRQVLGMRPERALVVAENPVTHRE